MSVGPHTAPLSSRERIMRALDRREVDRVPMLFWGVDPFTDGLMAREPSYARLLTFIRDNCDVKRRWLPNLPQGGLFYSGAPVETARHRGTVGGMISLETVLKTPKGELRATTQTVPNTSVEARIESYVKDEEDLARFLSLPYAPARPDLKSYFAIDHELGERGVVTHRVSTPLGLVGAIVDRNILSIWTVTARDTVLRLLHLCHERIEAYLLYLLENGVKPVFVLEGSESATPPMMSPADFEEFVVQFDAPLVRLIQEHGAKVLVHCHGNLRKVLPMLKKLAPNGLHPVEEPPSGDVRLEEVKSAIGATTCIVGGLQIAEMYDAGPEEIAERVRDVLRRVEARRGFILTTSATPYEVPLRDRTFHNYVAAIEEARAWS